MLRPLMILSWLLLLPFLIRADSRIVGGTNTGPSEYFVLLLISSPGATASCGGTLIHEDVVMTAGHCLGASTTSIQAIINPSFRTTATVDEVSIRVTRFFRHPDFNNQTFQNDIMLLRLEFPVDGFTPVEYNEDDNTPIDGQSLRVIGFGTTSSGGVQPEVLQAANVNAVSPLVCQKQYRFTPFSAPEDTTLCAAFPGRDSCQGDSGGPLSVERGGGQPDLQVGIVSLGIGCADPNFSGIYTRVSGFVDWIRDSLCVVSVSNPPDFCLDGGTQTPPTSPPTSSPIAMVVPTEPPTLSTEIGGSIGCFSGQTTVHVKDKGVVLMKDLAAGDLVQVSSDNKKFEPVYAFAHYGPSVTETYLRISTLKNREPLELTPNHLVFVKDKGYVPASFVQVGDVLSSSTVVASISTVTAAKGVFAPLTPSGTILVNDVSISTYVGLESRASHLMGINYHVLEHVWLSPLRCLCVPSSYYCPLNTTTFEASSGLASWAVEPLRMVRWLLSQHAIVQLFILVPFFLPSLVFALVESFGGWVLLLLIAGLFTLHRRYRVRSSVRSAK